MMVHHGFNLGFRQFLVANFPVFNTKRFCCIDAVWFAHTCLWYRGFLRHTLREKDVVLQVNVLM